MNYSPAIQRLNNAVEWCLALGTESLPERLDRAALEILELDSLDFTVPPEMLPEIQNFIQRWLDSRSGPELRSSWLDLSRDDCRKEARLIISWYHRIHEFHSREMPEAKRVR